MTNHFCYKLGSRFLCGISDLGWIEQRSCEFVVDIKDEYRKKCPYCTGEQCNHTQARRRALMLEDGGY